LSVSKLPLQCAVVSLCSVVKQRFKCNTGKVCNCLVLFNHYGFFKLRNVFFLLNTFFEKATESEKSINFLSLNLDGLPFRPASNTEPVSRNVLVSLRNALRCGTGVSGNFPTNCSCTNSVYILPSQEEKHVPQLKEP
jgi:hypothetical protein